MKITKSLNIPRYSFLVFIPFFIVGLVASAVKIIKQFLPAFTPHVVIRTGLSQVFAYPIPMPPSSVTNTFPPAPWAHPLFFIIISSINIMLFSISAVAATYVIRQAMVAPNDAEGVRRDGMPSLSLIYPVRLLVYHGFVTALFAVLDVISSKSSGAVEVPLALITLYGVGRTFLAPAAVVVGHGLLASFQWSWHRSRGHTLKFAVAAATVGIGGSFLADLPGLVASNVSPTVTECVGVVLATTVSGTAHAVVVGVAGSQLGTTDLT